MFECAGGCLVEAVVDVLCDGSGRIGALSYVVPQGVAINVGDGVHVPYGQKERHGLVLGPGNREVASKAVLEVFGPRVHPEDLQTAHAVAQQHFCELSVIAPRLSPPSGRGSAALQTGPICLTTSEPMGGLPEALTQGERLLLLHGPLVDASRLAAELALAWSTHGQVLILCPTRELVEAVEAHFTSGAARLDSKAKAGAWGGWIGGTVAVGIGTRGVAWYSARKLGAVVVVEEDHPGHVEASQPYTNAVEVAAARTRAHGARLGVLSTNPTTQGIGCGVKVVAFGGAKSWPRMRLVDRTIFPPGERLLPGPVTAALERAVRQGERAVVVAEDGVARRLCPTCKTPRLLCTRCTGPCTCELGPCPQCGETATRWVGWDCGRIARRCPPDVRVTTALQLRHQQDAAVVVVIGIDQALQSTGLSVEHHAARLIVQAAQACKPGGEVLVLTELAEHPLLLDLVERRDARAVAQRAWHSAGELALPPFGHLVQIWVGRAKVPSTNGWPGRVHGPRRVGEEWEIVVRVSREELPQLKKAVGTLRRGGKVRVKVT